MDLSTLAQFRTEPEAKAKRVTFRLPAARDIQSGTVLAFDQSFSSTGWVYLKMEEGVCRVMFAGTHKTSAGLLRGGEQDLERAHSLYREVNLIIHRHPDADVVLYETPPKGPGVRHPEVSLLCALSIRLAAAGYGIPFAAIHAKSGKKMLTGNANADKKMAHTALMTLDWIDGLAMVTNEGQRDAMLVALTYLRNK